MEKSGWMATRQTSQTPTSANNGTCALYSILNTHFMPLAKAKRLAARLLGRLPGQPAAMIGHRVDPTIAAIFDAYWYSRHAPSLPRRRPATPLFVIRSCRAIGSTSAVSRSLVSAQQSRRSGQRPQSACTLRQLWRKGRTSALRLLRRSLVLGNLPGSESRTNPLLHFIQHGAQAGHQPNPHFNTKWYVEHHPEAGAADTDPLSHYIYHGERRASGPALNSTRPGTSVTTRTPRFGPRVPPLSAFGQAEGRAGHRATDHDTETVAHSPDHAEPPPRCSTCSMPHGIAGRCRTFPSIGSAGTLPVGRGKEDWTLILFSHAMVSVRYPDVAESGQNALEHYVLYGASELRDPSEYFDVQQYCTEYAALIPAGANPLVHFLRHGARAGLNPNPISIRAGI